MTLFRAVRYRHEGSPQDEPQVPGPEQHDTAAAPRVTLAPDSPQAPSRQGRNDVGRSSSTVTYPWLSGVVSGHREVAARIAR